jgi:hypothetical protein
MKVYCQTCGAKFQAPDERIKGRIVKYRCRKCGQTIVADGTHLQPKSESSFPGRVQQTTLPPPSPLRASEQEPSLTSPATQHSSPTARPPTVRPPIARPPIARPPIARPPTVRPPTGSKAAVHQPSIPKPFANREHAPTVRPSANSPTQRPVVPKPTVARPTPRKPAITQPKVSPSSRPPDHDFVAAPRPTAQRKLIARPAPAPTPKPLHFTRSTPKEENDSGSVDVPVPAADQGPSSGLQDLQLLRKLSLPPGAPPSSSPDSSRLKSLLAADGPPPPPSSSRVIDFGKIMDADPLSSRTPISVKDIDFVEEKTSPPPTNQTIEQRSLKDIPPDPPTLKANHSDPPIDPHARNKSEPELVVSAPLQIPPPFGMPTRKSNKKIEQEEVAEISATLESSGNDSIDIDLAIDDIPISVSGSDFDDEAVNSDEAITVPKPPVHVEAKATPPVSVRPGPVSKRKSARRNRSLSPIAKATQHTDPSPQFRKGSIVVLAILAMLAGGFLIISKQKQKNKTSSLPGPTNSLMTVELLSDKPATKETSTEKKDPTPPPTSTETPETPKPLETTSKVTKSGPVIKTTTTTEPKTIPTSEPTKKDPTPPQPTSTATKKEPDKPTPTSKPDSKPPEATEPFNLAQAKAGMASAAAAGSSCHKPDDPSGQAPVAVTFDPSGKVTLALLLGPPFVGTDTGTCFIRKFYGVRIPAFVGGPTTVKKTYILNL